MNGHERDDVVEYHQSFFSLGSLNESNTPTEEAKKTPPNDLHGPPQEVADNTIILSMTKSTFQSNKDQPMLWAEKRMNVMWPKSKGSGIMVSDFKEWIFVTH